MVCCRTPVDNEWCAIATLVSANGRSDAGISNGSLNHAASP